MHTKEEREALLKAIEEGGLDVFAEAKDSLKSDREFVLEAMLKNSGALLEYASDSLKADREVVLAAVRDYGNALEYASDRLKADREIVLTAVTNHYSETALQYADDSLKVDREVVLAAVENGAAAFEYASEDLQQDKKILEARDGYSVLSDGSDNVEIPFEPDVRNYVLSLYGFEDWDWYEEEVDLLQRLLSETPVTEDLTFLLDWLKNKYFDLLGKIKEWNEEHDLFVPFKVDGGSIFLREVDFQNTDSMTLARDLIDRDVDLTYTIEEYVLYFVHVNSSYLDCFQFRGKRDYLALVSSVNCHYLKVMGRYSGTFRIESGELIRIDDMIFQEYERVEYDGFFHGELGEGWERDKVDEDRNFQAERIVHREYQGKGALSFFAADYEVRNWLDGAYVARNLRTGQ